MILPSTSMTSNAQFVTKHYRQFKTPTKQVFSKLNKELLEAYGVKPVDAREFEARLALKADDKDVQRLYQSKAEITVQENIKAYWAFLKRQLDQFLLVFMDYFRGTTNNTEGAMKHNKLTSNFLQQLTAIYKFLQRHDKE